MRRMLMKRVKVAARGREVSQSHIDDMARDLDQNGQLNPIRLTSANRIKDGLARYHAAKKLGWTHIYVFVEGGL